MTLWNKKEDKKTGLVYYDPRKHEMGKQLWREFSAISDRGGHKPGVIWWNTYLQGRKLLSRKEILQVCAVGVEYGAQSASMKDCYTDALSMNLELLNELGRTWQICVDDEVNNCEQAARIVGRLAQNLALAAELGRQMVEQAGAAAFVGRRIPEAKNKDKSCLYTAPKAYNSFLYYLRKLYPKQDEGGTE